MILPIRAYGDPVLRKKCKEIDPNYASLKELIDNMFETMYQANGIGLAAPQIGLDIRLFVADVSPLAKDEEYLEIRNELADFKKVFINPKIIKEEGELWKFNEGCLSIPEVREDVSRHSEITIEYFDENFVKKIETYQDIRARVIQHEYDHIEGVLFTDKLSAFKKKIIKGKLNNISSGNIDVSYKIRFSK